MTKKKVIDDRGVRHAVMVLGMHRSGTSALSGLLMKLGGDSPATLAAANRNNQIGYFESREIYPLQDELLSSAGSCWDDYQAFPDRWLTSPKANEYKAKMKQVLKLEYAKSSLLVIKDPRNCRLLPFWNAVLSDLQIKPLFVHTHRNPVDVAHSLQKRDGYDLSYGILLWLRHALDAEFGSRGKMRSFTSYNKLLHNWRFEVEKMQDNLGILWPNYVPANFSLLDGMIRPDLKHNDIGYVDKINTSSQWVWDVLEVLDRWAESGENYNDYHTLDKIREKFNESIYLFRDSIFTQSDKLSESRNSNEVDRSKTASALLEQVTFELNKLKFDLCAAKDQISSLKTENIKCSEHYTFKLREAESLAIKYKDQLVISQSDKRREDIKVTQEIKNLKNQISIARAEVVALRASHSWKITSPARWMVTHFRRWLS